MKLNLKIVTYDEYLSCINIVKSFIEQHSNVTSFGTFYDEVSFEPLTEKGFKEKLKNKRQSLYCFVYGEQFDEYGNVDSCDLLFHLSLTTCENKHVFKSLKDILIDYNEQLREF